MNCDRNERHMTRSSRVDWLGFILRWGCVDPLVVLCSLLRKHLPEGMTRQVNCLIGNRQVQCLKIHPHKKRGV